MKRNKNTEHAGQFKIRLDGPIGKELDVDQVFDEISLHAQDFGRTIGRLVLEQVFAMECEHLAGKRHRRETASPGNNN